MHEVSRPDTASACSTPPTPAATTSRSTQPPATLGFIQIGSDQGLLGAPRARPSRSPRPSASTWSSTSRIPGRHEVTLVNRLGAGPTARRDALPRHPPRDRRQRGSRRLADMTVQPARQSTAPTARATSPSPGRDDGRTVDAQRRAVRPRRGSTPARGWATEIWRCVADLAPPDPPPPGRTSTCSPAAAATAPARRRLEGHRRPAPGEAAECIARFDGYRGRYVFHCHNPEHEDMGMMANFEVYVDLPSRHRFRQ